MASMNLDEKANFSRLSRLLVDKGTEALRNTLDALHPSANLPAVLNANRTSLLKLKPRVLGDTQWDLLFPSSGNPPDSKTFDVTLLTVLMRNICGLPPPATGWNMMPPDTDRSPQANITRIKILRNQIYAHVSSTEVDKAAFENLWQKVSEALVDLKIPQKEIDDLKTCPLGPEEEIYVQILKEWVLKEEDCKNILHDLTTNVKLIRQQLIQSDLQRQNDMQQLTTNVTEEIRQGIQQLCPSNSMESQVQRQIFDSKESKVGEEHTSNVEEQLLQKLAKHNFKSKIRRKVTLSHPGTREWLLKKLDNWFTTDDESRLLLITAGPGFGKSVFAAKVCELFSKRGKLAACHFCEFNDSNLKDPMMMMQSLASHMCENVPGFKEMLLDQLKRPHKVQSLKDAFQIYLQNPLDELVVEPSLIVIDGLDESATDDKSDMMKLIADHFIDLPKCVKVLITSRPELSLKILDHSQIIKVDASNWDNKLDLLKYFTHCLPSLAPKDTVYPLTQAHQPCFNEILRVIVEKCEGSFLFAFHFQYELRKRGNLDKITAWMVCNFLPERMASIYQAYFHRLEVELEFVMNKKPDLCKVSELFVAACRPLPLKFLARTLQLDPDCREMRRIIDKVNEAVSCLLYVSDDLVTVFHRSVYDWLVTSGYEHHEYAVKVIDGKKRLWLICEQIFEEIKKTVALGRDPELSNEVTHALEYGREYLLGCNMKESFSWLVDMIIVYVILGFHPNAVIYLKDSLHNVLQSEIAMSLQLRQRISWHRSKLPCLDEDLEVDSFSYLESVLEHSPEGCFTDDEKRIARDILAKFPWRVKPYLIQMKCLKHLLAKHFPSPITAVGVSSSKRLAAVALKGGTICILSLPELVELFRYPTQWDCIPCCIFSPEDVFVLYGKLEAALSIAEKKEVPFFNGYVERFEYCSFSPNGKRLVTNDGSSTVKLWDLGRQRLVSVFYGRVPLNWCSFSKTGLFIIGNAKYAKEDPYCVWSAFTLQRVDLRSLSSGKVKEKDGFGRSVRCNRCVGEAHRELIPRILPGCSTGIYNEMDCIFYLDNQQFLCAMESIHLTPLAAWSCVVSTLRTPHVDITVIGNNLWLFCDKGKLIIFISDPPKENQSCVTRILWCSFAPDGSRLATCTSDGFINLWDVDTSQVYQRFRSNIGTSSVACWWSRKYLFVCHFNEDIPSLALYPVGANFMIIVPEMLSMPLCPVVKKFLPFSGILDFSEGYISFMCGETEPVTVVDVIETEFPKIVVLPGISPMMNITVSTGASFVLGADYRCFILWKRKEADPPEYNVHIGVVNPTLCYLSNWCFSDDLKFAVSFLATQQRFVLIDVDGRVCKDDVINVNGRLMSYYRCVPAKLFCTNGVIVLATSILIETFDLESRKSLGPPFQRDLPANSVIHSKLSPKGTILAVPTPTGDIDMFHVRHPKYS